jgi:predicted Holliday junction resolvase-like endonuclease
LFYLHFSSLSTIHLRMRAELIVLLAVVAVAVLCVMDTEGRPSSVKRSLSKSEKNMRLREFKREKTQKREKKREQMEEERDVEDEEEEEERAAPGRGK